MAARTARLSRRPPCSKASCSPPSPNPSSVAPTTAPGRTCRAPAAHGCFRPFKWTAPSSGVERSVRTRTESAGGDRRSSTKPTVSCGRLDPRPTAPSDDEQARKVRLLLPGKELSRRTDSSVRSLLGWTNRTGLRRAARTIALRGGCRENRYESVALATVGRSRRIRRLLTGSSHRNRHRRGCWSLLSHDQLTRRSVEWFSRQPPRETEQRAFGRTVRQAARPTPVLLMPPALAAIPPTSAG
jgi:hypothetical protein